MSKVISALCGNCEGRGHGYRPVAASGRPGLEQPFRPLGLPDASFESDGRDVSVFTTGIPAYAEVLEVRANRLAMLRG